MFKLVTLLVLFYTSLFSSSFNFTELRYSDAIQKSIELKGVIEFYKDGLKVSYPKNAKEIEYIDGDISYKESGKEVSLGEIQKIQIMRYFDVLVLLHSGDESSLDEMFEVKKDFGGTILIPKGEVKNYIDSIELLKDKKLLKYVKLYLKNSDHIMITIHDEIR